MKEFLFNFSWFERQYAERLGARYATFKSALNLFHQAQGKLVVETGCVRMHDDFGAGYSTYVLGDYCSRYDALLVSVDLSAQNMAICRSITERFNDHIDYVVSDSVEFFRGFDSCRQKIDLLYLDSYDYPYGELLNAYGGAQDLAGADATLRSMDLEQIVEKHGALIAPCQEHCLKELIAALPHIHDRTPILIDDNLPGGGKGRLARDWLLENGYTCLLDAYQSLWIKRL